MPTELASFTAQRQAVVRSSRHNAAGRPVAQTSPSAVGIIGHRRERQGGKVSEASGHMMICWPIGSPSAIALVDEPVPEARASKACPSPSGDVRLAVLLEAAAPVHLFRGSV